MQIDEVFRDQRGNNEKLKTYKLVVAGRCPLQHIPFLLQSNMPVHTRTHTSTNTHRLVFRVDFAVNTRDGKVSA